MCGVRAMQISVIQLYQHLQLSLFYAFSAQKGQKNSKIFSAYFLQKVKKQKNESGLFILIFMSNTILILVLLLVFATLLSPISISISISSIAVIKSEVEDECRSK